MISNGKAELHQLQTVYGVKDLYNMLEIITIDANNSHVAAQKKG